MYSLLYSVITLTLFNHLSTTLKTNLVIYEDLTLKLKKQLVYFSPEVGFIVPE